MAKLEREFAKTFAQHKNVISKHASIGEKRRRENEYTEQSVQNYKKFKLNNVKHQKAESMSINRSYLRAQRYSFIQ
jgi:ABC-type branched-subunit amino acid transport system ATPase component